MNRFLETPEYKAIAQFYGERKAKRSGVPLINHIHEGIRILEHFKAPDSAIRAYMIHPLFQNDAELATVGINFANRNAQADPFIIMLVMEYRQRANAWLSNKVYSGEFGGIHKNGEPSYGDIYEVKLMLIGDKIQNRKDFEAYHKGRHERSNYLDLYFKAWLNHLEVSEEKYQEVVKMIGDSS